MDTNAVPNHAAKLAAEAIQGLEPLATPKNAFIAFALGFAFGPLGVAIYFRSGKDFFICLAMLVLFSALMAFGPGELAGWLFSAGYGAWRAKSSNENRRLATGGDHASRIVDARIIEQGINSPAEVIHPAKPGR